MAEKVTLELPAFPRSCPFSLHTQPHGLGAHPPEVYTQRVQPESEALVSAPRKNTLRSWLLTVSFWSYMLVSNPVLWLGAVLLFVLTAPFDRKRKLLHLYTCAWAFHYVKLLPIWSTRFSGTEHIQP